MERKAFLGFMVWVDELRGLGWMWCYWFADYRRTRTRQIFGVQRLVGYEVLSFGSDRYSFGWREE